ncbi:MAG: hypothetical protein AAFR65_06295 [Pseudomonadota bacterium]
MRLLMMGGAVLLSACASLESEPLPEIGPAEYGFVTSVEVTSEPSGETRAERAAWGILSLNPVILATAVVAVEDDFGRSEVRLYTVELTDGTEALITSRYLADEGDCILIRRPVEGGNAVVVKQDDTTCDTAAAAVGN